MTSLDPATGVFSIFAPDLRFTRNAYGPFTCVVVEGAQPTLLCGDQYATYGLPLPAQQAAP